MRRASQVVTSRVSKCTRSLKKTFSGSAEQQERGFWSGRFDFLLASTGYTVGLGNVWKFPHVCYTQGGGAFLIPYFIFIAFVGVPIVFLEMALGQYTNWGPVHGWRSCPIMTGIGWGVWFMTASIVVYYNVIIAWSIYYIFASLTSKLPWTDCNNAWNDDTCMKTSMLKKSLMGATLCTEKITVNCTKFESPTVQYFERVALGYVSYDGALRKMTDPLGKPQWPIVLCLLLSSILVFLGHIRGIRSISKMVYFTALFPFVALLVLLIRGATLPGAIEGIKVLFTPDFSLLREPSVWSSAAMQVFFSLGAGIGGLMTLASYNKFNNNCYRDALIISAADCVTSLLGGTVVFSILGYISLQTGLPVSSVATSGKGLAFIVFTEAVSTMSGGPVWSTLFFVMLLTLGIDTEFTMMEVLLTTIFDQWPSLRCSLKKELSAKAILCVVFFLLGLPMCFEGGIYILEIFSAFATSFNLYVVTLGEVIGVCCFYGLDNFLSDINLMLNFKPGFYWSACWAVICPSLLSLILIFSIATYKRPTVPGNVPMSDWGETIGFGLLMTSMLIVIAFTVTWRPDITTRTELIEHRSPDIGPAARDSSIVLPLGRESRQRQLSINF